MKKKTALNKLNAALLARMIIVVILSLYMLRLLDIRNEIYILHDEFAYWATAAKYSGYSWNGMMVDSSYYSMGYSLLLVPLFYLGIDASVMYKLAIALNALCVIASYLISCFIFRKFFNGLTDTEIAVVCGIGSVYPYITTQANYAWPEIFLYFLFWLEICLLCRFAETAKLRWGFGAVLEGIWMFFVHQRALGVLAACILTVALIIFRNKDYYKSIISKRVIVSWAVGLTLIVIFTALFIGLKRYNLSYIFTQSDRVQMNDFSGQISRVRSVFSIKGIENFLLSFIGKYFYFCVSTVLVGPFALFILIRTNIVELRVPGRLEWQWYVKFFLIAAFFAMILITSVSTINDYAAEEVRTRIDIVFYGRYFEFTSGPFLMFGFYWLRKVKEEFTVYFSTIICTVITTIITLDTVKRVHSLNKVDLSAPAFNFFFWATDDYEKAILHGAVLVVFLFIAVGGIICFEQIKGVRYWLAIALIGAMWIKETGTNDDIIRLREIENEKFIYNTVAYIENAGNGSKLVYIYSDEDANSFQRYAFYIQYNRYQTDMQKIECPDLIEFVPEKDTIYIVMEDSSLKDDFCEVCELLYTNERINLFCRKENLQ